MEARTGVVTAAAPPIAPDYVIEPLRFNSDPDREGHRVTGLAPHSTPSLFSKAERSGYRNCGVVLNLLPAFSPDLLDFVLPGRDEILPQTPSQPMDVTDKPPEWTGLQPVLLMRPSIPREGE